MRVKVCGVCRPADGAAAAAAGADYVGVILAASSPRLRSLAGAAEVFSASGEAVRVGVFVDAAVETIAAGARTLGLGVAQLHGEESPDAVAAVQALGVAVWKAVRPKTADELMRAIEWYSPVVDGLLIDGWSAHGHGGVGARAPWDVLGPAREAVPPHLLVVLAGGLTADNLGAATAALAPDVVDVSSGVECEVGQKSVDRMKAFIAAARAAQPATRSTR